MSGPALECRGLTLGYGDRPVVSALDLEVAAGETLALLGPSGSGKSTLLFGIAGFIRPRAGEIRIAGRTVADSRRDEPPERRSVGFVFQSYALWPHLAAIDNVAYPLRRQGLRPEAARREAADLLDRMGLGRLAARRPAQLSGGEQQRVGLARALARRPALFLFDEPTAHLDAALRTALLEEVARQRRESPAAAIHATHDVAEALAVADRVALVRDGRLVQVGSPVEVYERPVDVWAARLTGAVSLIEIDLASWSSPTPGSDGRALAALAGVTIEVGVVSAPAGAAPAAGGDGGWRTGRCAALVRPEWAMLGGPLRGVVERVWYRGPHTEYGLSTDAGAVSISEPGAPRVHAGDAVTWGLRRISVLSRF